MIDIIADENITLLKGILDKKINISYLSNTEITYQELQSAKVLLVRSRNKVNKSLLENSNIKLVGSATIGTDHLDKAYLKKANIHWFSCPGCNSNSVLHYIASTLCLFLEKTKKKSSFLTLGIVGYGNIGSKVAELGKILGMNVLVNDPPLEEKNKKISFSSLEEVLKKSDIISIHTPYTKDTKYPTHHLINKNNLKLFKKNAFLINSSRGRVVCNKALLDYKLNNQSFLYSLDVWEEEPKINKNLLNNAFLATPHIAGHSIDGKTNATVKIVQEVSKFYNLKFNEFKFKKLPKLEPKFLNLSKNLNPQEILTKICSLTYDIGKESNELKKNPEKFEFFRNNYPIRRDLSYFKTYNLNYFSYNARKILKFLNIGSYN